MYRLQTESQGRSYPSVAANGFARGRKEGRVLVRTEKPAGIENGIADSRPRPFKASALRENRTLSAACFAFACYIVGRAAGDADACTTDLAYGYVCT